MAYTWEGGEVLSSIDDSMECYNVLTRVLVMRAGVSSALALLAVEQPNAE